MAFTCKNTCGKQEVEWLFLNNAWLPVITVCRQNLNSCTITPEDNTVICDAITDSLYLWDGCFIDNIITDDVNVTNWIDLNQEKILEAIDDDKTPGLIVSTNGGQEFNMLSFNGVSQGLVTFDVSGDSEVENNINDFTIFVVVNNILPNLNEDVGAIFTLLDGPFIEHVLLGWENGDIVLQHDFDEGGVLSNIVDPIPYGEEEGFRLIVVKYSTDNETSNIKLIVNGVSSETEGFTHLTINALTIG